MTSVQKKLAHKFFKKNNARIYPVQPEEEDILVATNKNGFTYKIIMLDGIDLTDIIVWFDHIDAGSPAYKTLTYWLTEDAYIVSLEGLQRGGENYVYDNKCRLMRTLPYTFTHTLISARHHSFLKNHIPYNPESPKYTQHLFEEFARGRPRIEPLCTRNKDSNKRFIVYEASYEDMDELSDESFGFGRVPEAIHVIVFVDYIGPRSWKLSSLKSTQVISVSNTYFDINHGISLTNFL